MGTEDRCLFYFQINCDELDTFILYLLSNYLLYILNFVSISSLFSEYDVVIYLMQQSDDKMESQKSSRVVVVKQRNSPPIRFAKLAKGRIFESPSPPPGGNRGSHP